MNSHYHFFIGFLYTVCEIGSLDLIVEVKIGRCSGYVGGWQEDRSRKCCPRASGEPHCGLVNTQLLPPAVGLNCERRAWWKNVKMSIWNYCKVCECMCEHLGVISYMTVSFTGI